MSWLSRLLHRKRQEQFLDSELRFHIEQQIADFVARGMNTEEARRRVALDFGGLEQIKEECRDARGTRLLETFWQDIRFSARLLRKSPGFTAVAILTLALGIGANAAVFSLLYSLVFRNLPVPHPEELVRLEARADGDAFGGLSLPMLEEISQRQNVFSSIFAWWGDGVFNVETDGSLTRADIWAVSGNFQSELGATPEAGRLIGSQDVDLRAPTATQVAVLNYRFWQRRYSGDRGVIGRTLKIEGVPFTIIGVTRKGFNGVSAEAMAEVMVPLTAEPLVAGKTDVQKSLARRDALWLDAAGRLKPGISLEQARAQLQSVWPSIRESMVPENPTSAQKVRAVALQLHLQSGARGDSFLRNRFTRPLYLLLALAGFVLLIACLNLASLMLARAAARRHEISVRLALGAKKWRLARQLLTESLMLSILGTLAGLGLALWGSGALARQILSEIYIIPAEMNLTPDARILGFTAAVAIITGILFGLAPVWRAGREAPEAALQAGSRVAAGATGKLGKSLVVVQVAVSLVLVTGAGLFLRTLSKLRTVDAGFGAHHLLVVHLYPKPGGYKDWDFVSYYRQLTERVRNLPGVSAAGVIHMEPASIVHWSEQLHPSHSNQPARASDVNMLMPGTFQAMGMSILRGRDFSWNDDEHSPRVAIVSRSFAEQFFPHGGAVGAHMDMVSHPQWDNIEIVGIVSDASLYDMRAQAPPTIYLSDLQYGDYAGWGEMLLQTASQPSTLETSVRQAVESQGREYVSYVRTGEEEIDRGLLKERLIALLSAFFGALALLLAGIGLYGLMAYNVTRRTREIGIRMALGAQRASVWGLVLRETLLLAAIGLALGIPCALAATSVVASMLFGISRYDALTLVTVSLALMAVGAAAGWIPARRAAKVDPLVALRCE
jgi:predicted permease